MRIYENGVYREMTAEEIKALTPPEKEESQDALTEMITEMSTATSLSQMREAAKNFLQKTEEGAK